MDDDDDDERSGLSVRGSVEPQMMPPQFQNPAFQHVRHQTPSASPPMPNGAFHPQQRQHTPQPGSRPSSRNASLPRRQSSNLGPQQHPHPQSTNGYAYMPNPAIYNPQQPGMAQNPHNLPQHMQQRPVPMQPMQSPPQGMPQGPHYPNYGPPQQQQHPHPQQVQAQMYAEDPRRASMPPSFPQNERPPSRAEPPPQQHQQAFKQEPQEDSPQQRQQLLEPVKRMSVKSRSIFTPIDESRSILSQHWASSTSNAETPRSDTATTNRSQSVDVGAVARPSSTPPAVQAHNARNISISSVPDGFHAPSRTHTGNGSIGGKRPVLKVKIPDEEEEESPTGDSNSSPRSSTDPTGRQNGNSSVVLPPPSPSASALLSAGASGPPNPFARPHPPSQNSQASNNLIDTPVSALPSRFMTHEFLPSPSSFFAGDWDFRNGNSNTMPSPLNFATPVVGSGPSFLREDSGDRERERERSNGVGNPKRKSPEADTPVEDNANGKRVKQGSP